MSDTEKLELLKSMLGIAGNDEDVILTSYLALSKSAIMRKLYPFNNDATEMPGKYDRLQVEIAVFLWNKRGAEGEQVHKENGIDRTYEGAYIPDSMLKTVIPYVGVL